MLPTRRALLVIAALAFAACPRRAPAPELPRNGPPRAFQLLHQTPERETSQLEERREDIEVDVQDMERTPRVVATGETPLVRLEGARARLFGDAAMTQGWAVDNFVLLEVLDEKGHVLGRAKAGFSPAVQVGREHVDNVGPMAFTFDPGEVELTSRLPEAAPFRLRATALDAGGVGRVSDLFLVLDYPAPAAGEDDLRNQ